AAKEQNKFAIGVDKDQNSMAPENVITSAMKRVDNAIYNLSKTLIDGDFPGGTNVIYGLKEGGVSIAPTSNKHVPQDILDEVAGLEAKIIAGEIVPPTSKDEWDAMK
ncbi:MAG: BMP family ABC transporter substrate-binding protein, partial [Candidatus Cloacimonadales bacterium]|nr:BMP family ABC transporter substrate-binding protein [Candidatus Cloacimonadales bacterium]